MPAALAVGFTLGTARMLVSAETQAPTRVTVTGEVVDTWCSISQIMYAEGTAHHQCAIWCAVGGIPVSIRDKDGNHYMVLRLESEADNVATPRLITIQSHSVTVDGDLYERDGVKYLFVDKVADDKGIVNMTHAQYGVVPFGE
ncbi:MAG: hypothetical protein NW205_10300 [Hyphomicrobiaceae bacterium]|nr:hypothetical protein [Hyphomicrobiaceae bacterium]